MELLIDNYHPYFRLFLLNDSRLWNLRNRGNESSNFRHSLHRACAACWARVCSLNRYGFNSHTEVVKPVALCRTKVDLTERWRTFKGKLNGASCSGQTFGCSGLQAFTSGALLTQTLFDFIFNNLFEEKKKTGFRTIFQESTACSPGYMKSVNKEKTFCIAWPIAAPLCIHSSLCLCSCKSITIVRQIINIVGHCKVSKQGFKYPHLIQKD